MIAKVIVHGRDRAGVDRPHEADARDDGDRRASRPRIPLHLKILNDPDFVAGRLSTHFMERFAPPAQAIRAGGIRLR